MKKSILLLALCLSLGVVLNSCKGEKKDAPEATEAAEMNENAAADKADIAMNDTYQCPMDCEHGKTYDKEGTCPVCNMNLKKVEKEGEQEGEHKHDEGDENEESDSGSGSE